MFKIKRKTMKINKYIMGLLMSLPFVSSCDNHVYEDASWHSWMPGMVYCSNGEIMSYENCVSKGNTPEAVLFLWIRKVFSLEKRMLLH